MPVEVEERRMNEPRREGESEFVTLASHELRAPVAAIHEIAKTLAGRSGPLDADQTAALHDVLLKNTELLTRLLDELLDLSRADAGGIALAPEPLAGPRSDRRARAHARRRARAATSSSRCPRS